MSWDKFLEGAAAGIIEFMEVAKGNKDLAEAMESIMDRFEEESE